VKLAKKKILYTGWAKKVNPYCIFCFCFGPLVYNVLWVYVCVCPLIIRERVGRLFQNLGGKVGGEGSGWAGRTSSHLYKLTTETGMHGYLQNGHRCTEIVTLDCSDNCWRFEEIQRTRNTDISAEWTELYVRTEECGCLELQRGLSSTLDALWVNINSWRQCSRPSRWDWWQNSNWQFCLGCHFRFNSHSHRKKLGVKHIASAN